MGYRDPVSEPSYPTAEDEGGIGVLLNGAADSFLQPEPRGKLSGEVTPKKAGVNVWLLREDVAQHSGMYFPSPGFTTTNANGQWGTVSVIVEAWALPRACGRHD
jgi:hypothetical protein